MDELKEMRRGFNCDGCEFEKTHVGDGCHMFVDRGDCYTKLYLIRLPASRADRAEVCPLIGCECDHPEDQVGDLMCQGCKELESPSSLSVLQQWRPITH